MYNAVLVVAAAAGSVCMDCTLLNDLQHKVLLQWNDGCVEMTVVDVAAVAAMVELER